jgi:alkylation response protein AidB-like acyl-CoA dehydrogenase
LSLTAAVTSSSIEAVLVRIAATADARDQEPMPTFPSEAIGQLEDAGLLAWNATPGDRRPPAGQELGFVRAVAKADSSVGRIFDGHLNGVERLAVQAPAELRDRELAAIHARKLRVGVWGGDPRPGEGPPAAVVRDGDREVLRGVKTFCSGAGGLDRALILARDPEAKPPVALWVDLTAKETVHIDESWYRGVGLRASVSHRVEFDRAPILARFGPPGALAEQPWFARDALRTAASWAGMADAAVDAALAELARRPDRSQLEELAAGRIVNAQESITSWLERAARAMDTADHRLPAISLHCRAAIVAACGQLLDEAARACGSHPFATGTTLDRTRRDLELFLLQHRLDPGVAEQGRRALEERSR